MWRLAATFRESRDASRRDAENGTSFRLDAVPLLIDAGPEQPPHELHDYVWWRRGDAVLLAEANVPPDAVHDYAHDGDELQVLFNCSTNQHLFSEAASITDLDAPDETGFGGDLGVGLMGIADQLGFKGPAIFTNMGGRVDASEASVPGNDDFDFRRGNVGVAYRC